MKTIAVLTSGGDAPGMNAAIRGVVRSSIYNGMRVMGIKMGYNGLINGDIFEMNLSSVADIIHRGGTILGTARSEEFKTKEGVKKALEMIKVFNIDGIVAIGGDGTMRGALELKKHGINVVAIPATIDNDLGYTDYSIGFMTATETAVDAISKLRDTSSSHGRANIVEVMGRHCGDIALYSGLAGGAETIIVPEEKFDMDELIRKAINGKNRGKRHHIIVVAEGSYNSFEICKEFSRKTGIDSRVTVLGHVQRGGTPTVFDRMIASEMAFKAVNLLKEDISGIALGIRCDEIKEFEIEKALAVKKEFKSNILNIAKILSI